VVHSIAAVCTFTTKFIWKPSERIHDAFNIFNYASVFYLACCSSIRFAKLLNLKFMSKGGEKKTLHFLTLLSHLIMLRSCIVPTYSLAKHTLKLN